MASNLRNFSHNSNFIFSTNLFGEETTYKLQTINLPGVNFSHTQVSKSAVFGNTQGDTVTYNPLSLSFIVDENLEIYKEFITLVQKMRNPDNTTSEQIEKYGYLEIQDDNTNTILKVELKNIMLESIADLQYSTNTEDEIITLDVSLVYDYFTLV